MRFILEQSDANLTSHSGLALIGLLMEKTQLRARLNQTVVPACPNPEISHADVVASYLGLLAQGKSDFEDIEPFREDEFFAHALGCEHVPSAPTMRQRFDAAPHAEWETIIREEVVTLLRRTKTRLTSSHSKLLPLDVDVSPFDNSDSKKEGVEITYKKVMGYAPLFCYLGHEGYLIDLELRKGSAHSQKGAEAVLQRALVSARQIIGQTHLRILVRQDAGHDDIDNIKTCLELNAKKDGATIEWLIKRNLRKETPEKWHALALEHGTLEQPRPGKKVWHGSIEVEREGVARPLRIVFRVIARTSSPTGQLFLEPTLEVDTYWTSLRHDAKTVIALYHEHGTMEQFHSEIKDELDLERLPSGKFATNSFVLHLGMLAYNMLRVLGQESLKIKEQPLRKVVKRRRVRTVIQNLITLAARVVKHARAYKLVFGHHSPWYDIYRCVYCAFST